MGSGIKQTYFQGMAFVSVEQISIATDWETTKGRKTRGMI